MISNFNLEIAYNTTIHNINARFDSVFVHISNMYIYITIPQYGRYNFKSIKSLIESVYEL